MNELKRYESLQAGLDLIDQGFTLIDRDLRMVAWNKTFLRLLDFPSEMGFVGATFESFMRYNAERGEYGSGDPERYIDERMRAARAFEPHDIERTRPNGTVLRIRGMPVPGHGFVTLYTDITAQKNAERQMRQLTGGLAHDFNNILTVIIGNLAALARARSDDAAVAEFADPALAAARRGAELIKGLLTFSHPQPLQAQATDVAPLLAAAARGVRRSLPEGLQLDIDAGAGPLWAWVDANPLQNSLLNLILNARDATPPPGRIGVRASAQVLDAEGAAALQMQPGRCVLIEVSDNGAGMDAATLARVFDPFFTTKPPGTGTGLGLAMVHGFVKQSGGAIGLRSTPGEGTTASLWLPACDAGSDAPSPTELADDGVCADRGLALLVEDAADVRRVVRRLLLELGFAVIEAENGSEAMQLLDQTPAIALLLSDVVMPGGVDGRALAAHARERGVPQVVLMSGYAPHGEPPEGVPMLAKPFTRAQLAALLAETA
ncbi:MAG TPA: PAS-domain containing protein [Albitalea sp.]|nr:PAS-domain containing protein [Albitalea sp.]